MWNCYFGSINILIFIHTSIQYKSVLLRTQHPQYKLKILLNYTYVSSVFILRLGLSTVQNCVSKNFSNSFDIPSHSDKVESHFDRFIVWMLSNSGTHFTEVLHTYPPYAHASPYILIEYV